MGRTTQNELTDALTSAMSAIADSSVQSKDATLTIEAEVVEVIDEGLGTYKVKYLGNQFEATTAHTEVTYSIGDMVYVVVPNGNFDKNKVILSPVNPSAVGYAAAADTSSGNTYINISDNLFDNVNDISMSTWRPIEASQERNLATYTNFNFRALFNASLKDSRTFNFSCKIRTDIEKERRSKGDYGLELHLPVLKTINGEVTRTDYVVKIDTNNINGDPYNLQTAALQNIYFTLPEDMDFYSDYSWGGSGGPWIGYFVKDFIGTDNTKPDDIFITDIQLLSVLEIKEEDISGYYITIKATEGTSFLFGRTGDEKTLSVLAFLNGKQTKNENFDCYWFKENVGIGKDNNKYHRLGGIGWELLNEIKETSYLEDGKPVYQYVTNNYTQKILQTDIHYDTVFKCVLTKDINTEKPIIKTATVTIKNLQNDALIELTTETGSTVFSQGIGDVVLKLKYHEDTITNVVQSDFNVGYYWQKLDKNGNIVEDFNYDILELNRQIDGTYYTKIKCPVSDIDEVNIFKCTVYIEINKQRLIVSQVVGTVSLMITIGQQLNGHIEVINDNKIYKYDADGNSPMSDGQYSGPLSDFITTIEPISIKLYKGDGNEFSSAEYAVTTIHWLVPINSLITLTAAEQVDTTTNPGYYTIKGKYNVNNQLNYGIAKAYNYNKTDNTIIVKAFTPSTLLADTLSNIARLTFLKDGEGGTNGTSYSAVITYNNYKYGENGHKLQLIYVADTEKWYVYDPGKDTNAYTLFTSNAVRLKATCYLQGEEAGNTASWSIFDSNHEKNSTYISAVSPVDIAIEGTSSYYRQFGRLTLNGNNMSGPDDVFCAIIQATITCSNSKQNAPTIIYAYYPIECTYLAYESYLENFIPYLSEGFSKVLYGADGSDPKYDQKSPFKLTNYYLNDMSNLFTYQWSGSPSLTVPNTNTTELSVKPISKLDNGVTNNYIKVLIKGTQDNLTNITNKITTLNNNKTILEKQLTYYQALQDNISVFTEFNNSYNYYKNLLLNTMSFYLTKTNLVKTLEDLSNKANELQTTTNLYKTKEDRSTDAKVLNVYNTVRNKINTINRLSNLCSQLGVEDVINQIKSIQPNTLIIEEISYNDNLPERDCYYTINNLISSYNYIISIYSIYVDSLNNSEILTQETTAKTVFTWLQDFASSNKLDNLTKTYQGHNEECYRYSGLIKAIEGRVNSAAEQVDTYSYNLIIENILQPIYNDLVWYISFANGEGYTAIINELNDNITNITNKITLLTFYKTIITELYYYNRVTASCCRPVVMTYNRYEMSFLNGWDGNKLDTGDGYIIAPQVGAGVKNGDNSFTGIVLGTKQIKENTTGDVGLFGYNYGVQTIFLNARNGSASFGEAGAGQVIIEPNNKKAIIKSGNYNDNNSIIYERVYPTTNPSELGYWESVLNEDSSAYIYVETTDRSPKANKAYYKKTDIKGGMLIDLSTPEIKFGTGNFKVTKEGHITAKGGGEIAGWTIDDNNFYSKASGQSRITIHSGDGSGHSEEGTYVYDNPCVFSGTHNKIDSTTKGFYIGPDGISITGKYWESSRERTSHFELNMSGNPKLFSGNHESLEATGKGFYLGQDGFSISSDKARIEISTTGDPKIYSNYHSSLDSVNSGFYISSDGLSIGSKVYIETGGVMRLGYGAVGGTYGKHWTIDGTSSNSYIKYGSQGESGSVYIGTDKITLGEKFSVTNAGKLVAQDAEIYGKIEANSGNIAGWKISQNTLSSADGKIKINSGGDSKFIEGPNAYIDLEGGEGSDGTDFRGCHINAANVCFSAGKLWTTRSRGATTLYEGKDYAVNIKTGYGDDYIYLHWINGLLIDYEEKGSGWH